MLVRSPAPARTPTPPAPRRPDARSGIEADRPRRTDPSGGRPIAVQTKMPDTDQMSLSARGSYLSILFCAIRAIRTWVLV